MLNTLTDEQLAKLGVSDKGDVMTVVIHTDSHKPSDEEEEEQQSEEEASEEETPEGAEENSEQEQPEGEENTEAEPEKKDEKPAEKQDDTTVKKVVFRYYVAELEDYYNVDSRKLSIELLNS